jgi:S1-C subfamily serine protease
VHRFRSQYNAGNYRAAIETLRLMNVPLSDAGDIERQLHCLAETGDSDGYYALLIASAELLGVRLFTPQGPAGLDANAAAVLARVSVVLTDGSHRERGGFVIGDGLVATIGHGLNSPQSVHVSMGASKGAYVQDISRAGPDAGDIVVLKLTEQPAAAIVGHCGYSRSVRIGDRVWAHCAVEDAPALLVSGLVDTIESDQDGTPHTFRVGMAASGLRSGDPLFNELGEVIGLLAVEHEGTGTQTAAVTALTSDALRRF